MALFLRLSWFIDGRLIFATMGDAVEIKYQLLNPSALFRDVVEVARSVVLAGGTMSPVSSFVDGSL